MLSPTIETSNNKGCRNQQASVRKHSQNKAPNFCSLLLPPQNSTRNAFECNAPDALLAHSNLSTLSIFISDSLGAKPFFILDKTPTPHQTLKKEMHRFSPWLYKCVWAEN